MLNLGIKRNDNCLFFSASNVIYIICFWTLRYKKNDICFKLAKESVVRSYCWNNYPKKFTNSNINNVNEKIFEITTPMELQFQFLTFQNFLRIYVNGATRSTLGRFSKPKTNLNFQSHYLYDFYIIYLYSWSLMNTASRL